MESIYVPIWLVSGNPEGTMIHECVERGAAKDGGNRIDYVYEVKTTGSVRVDKVPVNTNSSINEKFIEAVEPFDYGKMVRFDSKYIIGHFADCGDMKWEKCFDRVKNRVRESVSAQFASGLSDFKDIKLKETHLKYENLEKTNVLVPVWFLNIKYKGEMYSFTINGQTGKVAGVLPMGNVALVALKILYSIGCVLGFALVGLLGGPLLSAAFAIGGLVWSIKQKGFVGKKIHHVKYEADADHYINLNSVQILGRESKKIREITNYLGAEGEE